MSDTHELILSGCTPSPLANYLKGLGVLRILGSTDETARAAWRGESLLLKSFFDRQSLVDHFLHDYRPTPVMAPWNGGSGFYAKDNKKALQAIAGGASGRLSELRDCLAMAEEAMSGMDRTVSPKGDDKNRLLTQVRALLPDVALDWFDAAIVLAGDGAKFPPLLGTGGNDGRLDFTNNFMQRLVDVMDPETGVPTKASRSWLELALFGDPAPALVKNAIGQFAPGQVGGPNATTGFDSKGGMNPWDFILMIEGAMPFAAAAVRRNGSEDDGVLSYPFTVRATSAGTGSLGAEDSADARGELWMPLWSRFASYHEVRALLAEGRVALGKRPARDALDFVRAVHRLGGYRGVDRYQRFGLLMRSGKAYLATSLQRVQVTTDPQSDWIDELDGKAEWLSRFRRFASADTTAKRFVVLRHRLENLLFDVARQSPSPSQVQALLALLGEIQSAIATSTKAREVLKPVPRLSERWVMAANDYSPAFRIACALASLSGSREVPLPLRAQWYPVHPRYEGWMDEVCKNQRNDPTCGMRLQTPSQADLPQALIALLQRRLWLGGRLDKLPSKPLNSWVGARLDDLMLFLSGDVLDRDIVQLLPGLLLCTVPQLPDDGVDEAMVPAAYALMRMALTPDAQLESIKCIGEGERVPVPEGLVSWLATSQRAQTQRAVEVAWRRLRASGLAPIGTQGALPELMGIDPRRAAASLLIPLSLSAIRQLSRIALQEPETTDDVA